MANNIRMENWIIDNDIELLIELKKTYYGLNAVHDDIHPMLDNGHISGAMNACSRTVAEILSKYVRIEELGMSLDASEIEQYLLNGCFQDVKDGNDFQQIVLNLIWNELKCIDHNEIILFEDATTDYNNAVITLSDAHRMMENGEDLIVVSTGLEDRIKEIYYTDDISHLRCIIEYDKDSANSSHIQINHYWWLVEELAHYNSNRNWRSL